MGELLVERSRINGYLDDIRAILRPNGKSNE